MDLLKKLYAISGGSRIPEAESYFIVAYSMQAPDEAVRERAVFIGALRWMDPTMLSACQGALVAKSEPSDDIRRLMVEALVGAAMERGIGIESAAPLLQLVLSLYSRDSYTAKAAYVGLRRLAGEMTKNEFAVIDYDDVSVPVPPGG